MKDMNYEIDEIRKVRLGGVTQKIHIRGEKKQIQYFYFCMEDRE